MPELLLALFGATTGTLATAGVYAAFQRSRAGRVRAAAESSARSVALNRDTVDALAVQVRATTPDLSEARIDELHRAADALGDVMACCQAIERHVAPEGPQKVELLRRISFVLSVAGNVKPLRPYTRMLEEVRDAVLIFHYTPLKEKLGPAWYERLGEFALRLRALDIAPPR